MNGSRSNNVTHSNGHGAAKGASEIEISRPQPPKLVDELAQAMGMGQDTFERPRPAAATAPVNTTSDLRPATTTLPAMPPPRNFFDDEDDDASMPIPSTWRNPPEPPRGRGLSDQLRATGLGFATGLAIVVPTVLLLTGHLDNSSFSKFADMLQGSMTMSQDQPAPAQTTEAAPRVQQRAVATTTVTSLVAQPAPAIAAAASPVPAPEPHPVPVASAPVPPVVPAAPAPAPELAPAPSVVASVPPQEAPRPPIVAETAPTPDPAPVAAPLPVVEAPPAVAAPAPAPAPIASLPPAKPAPLPAAAPAAAPSPAQSGGEIAEGRERFRNGDIAGGRNLLARGAAGGNAEAILALAETYDPNMLAAWGVVGASPDVATARRLYAKARDSGLEIAGSRLKGLE